MALPLTLAVLLGSGEALADEPPAEALTVCVSGQLTDEGIECPELRTEDQSLYTLAGETGPFDIGDHVCVRGAVAEVSFCMQGTTIDVTHISPRMERCVP